MSRTETAECEAERRRLLAETSALVLILVERFGYPGQPSRSVDEVAQRFGLTREELRLVEGRVVGALNILADVRARSRTSGVAVSGGQRP